MADTDLVRTRARVVAISGCALGIAAALAPSGLLFRANRVFRGEPSSLLEAFGAWGWVLLCAWLLAALLAASPLRERIRGLTVTLLGAAVPILTLWQAGSAATDYVESTSTIARTSLGLGFWLTQFAAYMLIFAATAWLEPGASRVALTYLPVAGVVAIASAGGLTEIGIAREYANNMSSFWREFRLHLSYVAGAVAVGLVAGLLSGVLAAKKRSLEPVVFGSLNVLQVLPTLAFIGLLNPVLSGLSERIALFEDLGVRGVGWAPVIIVLSSYAVYPIARNTHAAIASLDRAVTDAARGVGMGRLRMLAEIELPLALPVVIAGVRVALVQTTAGAIIAGLVGGGGLGIFVFLGASETATDLILLGVVPIVALALFFDRALHGLERLTGFWSSAG